MQFPKFTVDGHAMFAAFVGKASSNIFPEQMIEFYSRKHKQSQIILTFANIFVLKQKPS